MAKIKNKTLAEGKYGHGAIAVHPLHRFIHKSLRPTIAKSSVPFDWIHGFDIESQIGKVPIKDQGQSFSCGGQAGSYFLEVQRRIKGIPDECSAKSVYAPIAYPGGGTTISSLETQIGAHGANLESAVPSSTDESQMEDKSWMTPALAQDALKRAGFLPASVPIDIDSMAEAIRDNGGIIMEIRAVSNGTWFSAHPQPPAPNVDSSTIWAHFMCGKGAQIVNGVKQLAFFQSWGPAIGDNGIQYFTEDYINSGYIIDVFTFVSDTALPIQGGDTPWEAVVNWFRDFFASLQNPATQQGGSSSLSV